MLKRSIIVAVSLLPGVAQAHVGVGDTSGFSHGFFHPLSGVDHVLVMVAVGVLAAQMGGRALWLVPAAFLAMMIVGGVLGVTGVAVPYVEVGIGVSVVVLGLLVAMHVELPTVAAMALVGLFAIFHGHAHGAEMPQTASGIAYGFGFVVATALLHIAGIGLGLFIGSMGAGQKRVAQVAGGAMSIAGLAILGGAL